MEAERQREAERGREKEPEMREIRSLSSGTVERLVRETINCL